MKQIKTPFYNLFALLLIALFASSCSKENPVGPQEETDFTLQTNAQEFERLLGGREAYEGAVFEIKDLKRDGDFLKVILEGPGNVADYKVVWNGILLLSHPAQTHLIVAYERPDSPQHEAILTHELNIDLKKLFGSTVDPKDVIVTVSNGSKPADSTVDPNGTVSNK